jgi:biopolymer transport protein ExbD
MRARRHKPIVDADLDITSFMNLMIILVPVLLMTMAFSHVTVLGLKLPDLSAAGAADDAQPKQLELVLREQYIDVNYPVGVRLKRITTSNDGHDYGLLSTVLQEVKRQLRDQGIEKRDIVVLAEPDTDYQTLVSVMDTARSFDVVVAAAVVQGALFPNISLGDAPPAESLLAAEER